MFNNAAASGGNSRSILKTEFTEILASKKAAVGKVSSDVYKQPNSIYLCYSHKK